MPPKAHLQSDLTAEFSQWCERKREHLLQQQVFVEETKRIKHRDRDGRLHTRRFLNLTSGEGSVLPPLGAASMASVREDAPAHEQSLLRSEQADGGNGSRRCYQTKATCDIYRLKMS